MPKKIELVLMKEWRDSPLWWLTTQQDETLMGLCGTDVTRILKPGRETCLILEITAHPAVWTGGSDAE